MAIYRCEFKIYSRGKAGNAVGHAAYVTGSKQTAAGGGSKRGGNSGAVKVKMVSAVEAAAYRANELLHDERQGQTHDYSRKENVVWSGILAPESAPAWAHDRAKLWNAVEAKEDSSTRPQSAQLFREALLTIPRELSRQQQIALVRAYVQDQFVSRGMVADIGIHAPEASDGMEQPHAHVMLTLRDIGPDGFGNKRRDWNDVQWRGKGANTARVGGFLHQHRASWEDYCNAALEDAGSSERIDHRSLKDRGIDRKPEPKIGKAKYAKPKVPAARSWIEAVDRKTRDVGSHNRAVEAARVAVRAYRQGGRGKTGLVALSALLEGGEVLTEHVGSTIPGLMAADDAIQRAGGFTLRLTGHGPERPGEFDPWGHDVG